MSISITTTSTTYGDAVDWKTSPEPGYFDEPTVSLRVQGADRGTFILNMPASTARSIAEGLMSSADAAEIAVATPARA